MPTTLYFHNFAYVPYTANIPNGQETSANITPTGYFNTANTLRTMDTLRGVGQATATGNVSWGVTTNTYFVSSFASPPLTANATVSGNANITLSMAANSTVGTLSTITTNEDFNLYVWRPSSNTKVGTAINSSSANRISSASTERTILTNLSLPKSAANVSALVGDIIVVDIFFKTISAKSGSSTGSANVFFDGSIQATTSNVATTNDAAYITLVDDLTFEPTRYPRPSLTSTDNS